MHIRFDTGHMDTYSLMDMKDDDVKELKLELQRCFLNDSKVCLKNLGIDMSCVRVYGVRVSKDKNVKKGWFS